MHIVCMRGKLKELKILLSSNNFVNINIKRGQIGATPLILACYNKQFEIVKYLLLNYHNNINIFESTIYGVNCLMAAVINNNFKITKYIFNYLLNGLNNNKFNKKQISNFINQINNKNGKTSVIYAYDNNNIEIIKLFIDNKNKFNINFEHKENQDA